MDTFNPTPEQAQALDAFKAVCLADVAQIDSDEKIDAANELCWRSLSIGFFLAQGLSSEHAHEAASYARYKCQYWQG